MVHPKNQPRGLMISDLLKNIVGNYNEVLKNMNWLKLLIPNLPSKAQVVFKFGSQGDGY